MQSVAAAGVAMGVGAGGESGLLRAVVLLEDGESSARGGMTSVEALEAGDEFFGEGFAGFGPEEAA